MSGGGQTTSTTQQQLSPEQQQLLKGVLPTAQAYTQTPPSAYPGTLTAPISPYTYQGQSQALGAAAGPIQSQTEQAMAGSQWLTSGQALNAQSNPYLQSAINAAVLPITQNFQRTVIPQENDAAIQAGQFGYNRQGLQNQQDVQSYLNSIGSTAAQMASTGYGQGLNAMTSALMSAPQVARAGALPSEMTSAVGTQQQQLQQQAIDAAIQQYYTGQFLPLTVAQQVAAMAFGMPGGQTVAQQQVPGTGAAQDIIGGTAAMAPIVAAALPLIFSDRRMKQNIIRIGTTPQDIPLYEFEFKAMPGIRVQGIMAQDVPWAAIEIDGVLHVDMERII